jgi:hypothetical protein
VVEHSTQKPKVLGLKENGKKSFCQVGVIFVFPDEQVDGAASAWHALSNKIGSVIFRKPRGRGMDSVGRRGRPWKAVEDISVHGRPGGK